MVSPASMPTQTWAWHPDNEQDTVSNPLDDSVQYLKGVGPNRADVLERLGIRTLRDLLLHLPRSFDDLSDLRTMDRLEAGVLQTVRGEVVEMQGKELASGRTILSI